MNNKFKLIRSIVGFALQIFLFSVLLSGCISIGVFVNAGSTKAQCYSSGLTGSSPGSPLRPNFPPPPPNGSAACHQAPQSAAQHNHHQAAAHHPVAAGSFGHHQQPGSPRMERLALGSPGSSRDGEPSPGMQERFS